MMESRTERKEHMSVVVLVERAAQGVAASGAVGGGEGGGTLGEQLVRRRVVCHVL